jgi:outer membrane protein
MPSRQFLVALLAAVSLIAPRAAGAADLKLAYVDLQRAFAEVEEGKVAKAKLEQMRDAKQKEIDKEQEVLRKEKETFEKQMATMTEATRQQKGTELQKKLFELQQRFEKGRSDLSQNEREILSGILGKMQPIIATIAQRDGFTMVFEKTDSGLLFAPASLDLTNELIRLYNEKNKVTGTTPASTTSTPAPKKTTDAPKK